VDCRGPFLTSHPGARGEVVPQGGILSPGAGVKFSVRPSVLLNSRVFTPGGEQRGEHSPQGTNFIPGSQVHP
jgi:hypothetical protein